MKSDRPVNRKDCVAYANWLEKCLDVNEKELQGLKEKYDSLIARAEDIQKQVVELKTQNAKLPSDVPWTKFKVARTSETELERIIESYMVVYNMTRKQAVDIVNESVKGTTWMNSRYQVIVRPLERKAKNVPEVTYLSIKRIDKEPIHDWRDMQRIKNELCGEDREGVELYPREKDLVDGANQYHMFVLQKNYTFPFGFRGARRVEFKSNETLGSKQRPKQQ